MYTGCLAPMSLDVFSGLGLLMIMEIVRQLNDVPPL
jgi:hypothetical protein